MRYNKLMKTASALLTTVMTLGLFAFVAPAKDVKAGPRPTATSKTKGITYEYEMIEGVKWIYLKQEYVTDFGGKLPDSEEFEGSHFLFDGNITVSDTTVVESNLTFDLYGFDLIWSGSGKNLAKVNSGCLTFTTSCLVDNHNIIDGAGKIGEEKGGLFYVGDAASLIINDVSIRNGGGNLLHGIAGSGGAVYVDTNGYASFTNSNISNCYGWRGGAICNFGTVSLTNTNITGCHASTYGASNGDSDNGNGGGIYNPGMLLLTGSIAINGNEGTGSYNDVWINSSSNVSIGSSSNNINIFCSGSYSDEEYNNVFSLASGGKTAGINCSDRLYEIKWDNDASKVVITRRTDKITFAGASATLNDETYPIVLNMSFDVPEILRERQFEITASYETTGMSGGNPYTSSRKATGTLDEESKYIDGYYVVSLGFDPSYMMKEVKWQITSGEEVIFEGTIDNLATYLYAVTESTDATADQKKIAKAFLAFGAYAENYFDKDSSGIEYVTSVLPDALNVSDADLSNVTGPTVTGFAEESKITYYGTSVLLDQYGMKIRNYVIYDGGSDVYGITSNGIYNNMNSKRNSQNLYFYYDTSSYISFYNLDKAYTSAVMFNGENVGTITYSVLDYIKVVQEKQSNKTDLNNYLKAMYALYSVCKAV